MVNNVGRGYSLAKDGSFVFITTKPDLPSDLAIKIPGKDVKIITSVNADILAHKELGKVEEIWYKSSFDGLDIQGWIMKPPDFDKSKNIH